MKAVTFLMGCLASIVLAGVAENFTKSGKEFEAAESRAAQNYERSEKATLSGQIFVATKGGENVKFGAVQVSLFARDAIDVLLAGLKAFADAKIEELQLDIAAAQKAEKQAEVAEKQAEAAEEQARAAEEAKARTAEAQASAAEAQARAAEEAQAKAAKAQATAAEAQATAAEAQAEATLKRNQELYEKGFTTAAGLGPVHAAGVAVNVAREAVKAATERANAATERANAATEHLNAATQRLNAAREAVNAATERLNAARERLNTARERANVPTESVNAATEGVNTARKAKDMAKEKITKLVEQKRFCYSGRFYFSYLRSPIEKAETDGDGKFVIQVPRTGAFVIAAQAERSIGNDTETYYWLQPVSLQGELQLVQNLSNNNLTRTTGTSSLIATKD